MNETPKSTASLYTTKPFPLFSIITITLNNYQGLKETYNSLKIQKFTDYEWLVIDGRSSDKTIDFLRKHRSNTRTNKIPFRFVSQTDEGIYDAMNTGIEMAHGHYLLFLNAGDTLADAKTLDMLAPHCKKSPDFVYGDAYEQYKNGRKPVIKTAQNHKEIHWGLFTHHQAMLYRRHTVRDAKLRYSLRYKIASDYDFTARFLKECDDIIYIDKPICIFDMGGISQQNAGLGRREQYLIRESLEMVTTAQNLWILLVQTLSWNLRAHCPWLYKILKPAGKQLLRSHSDRK